MKNFTKLFAIAVVVLGFSATSFGQAPTTFTAKASVNPVASVSNLTDLNFGAIGQNVAGGDVVISTAGARSGSALLLSSATGAAGEFTVGGTAGQTVGLTLPAGDITLYNVTTNVPADNMVISAGDLKVKIGTEAEGTLTHVLTAALVSVKIGGTLQVNSNQALGIYQGTYQITVALN